MTSQAVTAYNTEVEAENSRLRKAFDEVLRNINTGQPVLSALCTFCGEHWPRLDGETFDATKQHGQEHAMQCREHPLRLEIERLKAELDAVRQGDR